MRRSWNPRFVAYAKRTGAKSPRAALRRDVSMTGFMIWISQRWQAWDAEKGFGPDHVRSHEEHADFTAWLFQ